MQEIKIADAGPLEELLRLAETDHGLVLVKDGVHCAVILPIDDFNALHGVVNAGYPGELTLVHEDRQRRVVRGDTTDVRKVQITEDLH